ncbi:MAG: ATP-dependent DNA helicase [Acidiferrobacteraceae bacterium]
MAHESAKHAVQAVNSGDLLGAEGPFAGVPGFVARPSQAEMSVRIEQSIRQGGHLLCESGPGTGKTLAYLVPVLTMARRTIISTGTRSLQEQLFHKDLPLARSLLNSPARAVLLKGRSNYLCWERLDALRPGSAPVHAIRSWAEMTTTGDLGEAPGLAEEGGLWRELSMSADDCLGTSCRSYERCWILRARREAAEADIVIANHHLFFAHLALGADGLGRLLPRADAVIFDEAHQLPALAAECFGEQVSSIQLLDFSRALREANREEDLAVAGLSGWLDEVEHRVTEVAQMAAAHGRCSLASLPRGGAEGVSRIQKIEQALSVLLEPFADSSGSTDRAVRAIRRGRNLLSRLRAILADSGPESVAWMEASSRGFILRLTPGRVGPEFRRRIDDHAEAGTCAHIFVSATLCVGESFSHFMRLLAIEDAATARWESTFDYPRQALLYLPRDLPEPGTPDYLDRMIDEIVPVLEMSRGRAFVLFTTHRALAYVHDRLPSRIPFPVFAQGTVARGRLIDQFRTSGNGVLLGTGSFWEGVDVAGAALSCVIIDKLPFAPPDDPVEQARLRMVEEQGGNGFRDHQLPQAVMALKQGAGRLIRTASDRGVLVVCDPRVRTRGYGRMFLDTLPPMPVSDDISDVARFFDPASAP